MDHDAVIELLPDFVLDRLDEAARERVEKHLEACEECRSVARSCRMLGEAMKTGTPAYEDHPSSAEIVSFVLDASRISREEWLAINAHVERCVECRREVDAVSTVEADADGRERRAGLWALFTVTAWQRALVPVAAALLVAVLAYPAYRGVFLTPRLSNEAAAAREESGRLRAALAELEAAARASADELAAAQRWSAAAPLHLITSGQRGPSSRTKISLSEPVVAFGVDLPIPRDFMDSDTLRFEIVDDGGKTAVQTDVTVGEARAQIRETGVVTFLVSSRLLRPGLQRVRVLPLDQPGWMALAPGRDEPRPLADAEVEVSSPDEQAPPPEE